MNRRGFLQAILAAAVAPAIVRADSLMRVVPLDTTIDLAIEPSVSAIAAIREAYELVRYEGIVFITQGEPLRIYSARLLGERAPVPPELGRGIPSDYFAVLNRDEARAVAKGDLARWMERRTLRSLIGEE